MPEIYSRVRNGIVVRLSDPKLTNEKLAALIQLHVAPGHPFEKSDFQDSTYDTKATRLDNNFLVFMPEAQSRAEKFVREGHGKIKTSGRIIIQL